MFFKKRKELEATVYRLNNSNYQQRNDIQSLNDRVYDLRMEMNALLRYLELEKVDIKPGIKMVSKSSASLGD